MFVAPEEAPLADEIVETTPTPPAGSASPPSTRPEHHPHALRLAHEFGYEESLINSLTPDQLSARTHADNLYFLGQARQLLADRHAREAHDANGRPAPRPAAAPEPPPDPDEEALAELREYNPKLEALLRRLDGRAKQAATEAEAVKGTLKKQLDRSADELFDGVFDALGADYDGVFGKGSIVEIGAKSDAAGRRWNLIVQAKIDPATDTLRAAVAKARAAAKFLYPMIGGAGVTSNAPASLYAGAGGATTPAVASPAVHEPPAPAKPVRPRGPNGQFLSDEEAAQMEWLAATTARPTSRSNVPEPDGKAKAIAGVTEFLRSTGRLPEQALNGDDATLDDMFPDFNQ